MADFKDQSDVPATPAHSVRFVISWKGVELSDRAEPLFLAEPFVGHLLDVHGLRDAFPAVRVAPFIRNSPQDLHEANALLWEKYRRYLPLLAARFNEIHETDLPADFWRRALSMGLMRHLTMVYDSYRICDTWFDPERHAAFRLSPDCYHTPVNYDEQRWFLSHSHHGQEQLFSLYLRFFHPGAGEEYRARYSSGYSIPRYRGNAASDPVVGIMRALFRQDALQDLATRSRGDVASIGYDGPLPSSESVSPGKRSRLALDEPGFDPFDRFFFHTLPVLMPREFVEDFRAVFDHLSAQLRRYRRLRYVVSETFIGETYESIALAILSLRGVKVVYNEHNYSEYPYLSNILEQQTSLADRFAAHGDYDAPIRHKIPAGSLFEFSPQESDLPGEERYPILYSSGIGIAKYANYAHSFGETAEHAARYYEFKVSFFRSLGRDCLRDILYRAYPRDANSDNWGLCYDDSRFMEPFRNEMTIDDHSRSNKVRMMQSGLVIVDYVSTSHFESMSMNIPTVILLRPGSYELNEENRDYFESLSKVGICQDDPVAAARFVEMIRHDPGAWWESPEVQSAKDRFLERNLGKPEYLKEYLLKLSEENIESQGEGMKTPLSSFMADGHGVWRSPGTERDFAYSDGEERENRVLGILSETRDCSTFSEELRAKVTDWASEYHFSRERHNLLRHLALGPEMEILEMGCGCGAITRQLGESGATVTSVEGSLPRARSAAARCRDLPNVKVYRSNFQDIEFERQYDLVTFIGVLEYSPQYFASADPIRECLGIARKALKPDGVLVVAIENQLGLKYFCGFREDHADIPYFGIEDRYDEKTAITFGRRELARILEGSGFGKVEFHYPFPDYKVPKAVFTEKAFRDDGFFPEEIIRQMTSRDYSGDLEPAFREQLAVPVLCRNGLMEDLSHSFLVLATREGASLDSLRSPDLLARVYASERNAAYSIQTGFSREGSGILVRKQRLTPPPTRFPGDILAHKLLPERYRAGVNLEAEYRKFALKKDFDSLFQLFGTQLEYLLTHAILVPEPGRPVRSTIRPEFVDCIPSNLILREGKLEYIDREWEALEPVTLGALLLRTVDALGCLDPAAPELKRDHLLSMLDGVGLPIDAGTLREYDGLIRRIVAQVYDAPGSGASCGDPPAADPLRAELSGMIDQIASIPEPPVSLRRFAAHLDELLRVRDGHAPDPDYPGRIAHLGPASADEIGLCREAMALLERDADWEPVSRALAALVRKLENGPGSRDAAGERQESAIRSLAPFKSFFYRDEFRDFVCPNPFLYAELRQNGDVSSCCYLPFTLGNVRDRGMDEIWNSDIARELRRSIRSGEFCYCDKRKCAAMQQARLPVKQGMYEYQLPYRLQRKADCTDEALTEMLASDPGSHMPGPRILSFEDDPTCNLSCPSCRHEVIGLDPEARRALLDAEVRLLDSAGSGLREVWFSGAGDPFASAVCRELFRTYDFGKHPDLRFRLDTNGLLLDESAWNALPATIRERVGLIAVSVDAAAGATYSEIRRGGNFETLMANLGFLSSLPERARGTGFILRMIVQKKNFGEMIPFVELGRSLNADSVVFSSLQNWGTFTDAEYRDQAVHLPDHPRHGELMEILKDPVFGDPLVDLGNLAGLRPDAAIAGYDPAKPPRSRIVAFYLPQFHPIPENDVWWGKGFTEWTNVTKAKPLYEGHYQPHLAGELGYYDLRVPEVWEQQARLAQSYGVDAFCYWHYWFAGKRLLERPFEEVVRSGKPDFPFCLGWANQTWSGIWHGAPDRILIEQTYPGFDDYKAHFDALLPAFRDSRYFRVNGRLLFVIYAPANLPDARAFTSCWQELAAKSGIGSFHFVAHNVRNPEAYGCDSCVDNAPFATMNAPPLDVVPLVEGKLPRIHHYRELVRTLGEYALAPREYPLVVPNWDNTPRSGANGLVLHGSTPELFREMLEDAIRKVERSYAPEDRIVFVKAWNEWAEGNHLEPDHRYGHRYLEVLRECRNPGSPARAERNP